jgi:hypothetical protein
LGYARPACDLGISNRSDGVNYAYVRPTISILVDLEGIWTPATLFPRAALWSLANTRRLIGATFYLFGGVLFLVLPNVQNTLGARSTAAELRQILGSFLTCCEFAAIVFFVFFVLHVAEWLVYLMLNRCSKRLNGGSRSRENKMSAVGT